MNDFLQLCKKKLRNAGVENAYKEIDWYLEQTTQFSQTQILSNKISINNSMKSSLLNFIERRIKKEPFQYIINSAPFYGRNIYVNPDVLIPRPETETIINILKSENKIYDNALDIGTGSGNLAITLSLEKIANNIIGLDKSTKALKIAQKNSDTYNIQNIKFFSHDFIVDTTQKKFDLIISNPPYISREEYKQLDSSIKDFEPINALTDFQDGLLFYKKICQTLPDILNQDGTVLLEIGLEKNKELISQIFTNYSTRWYKDLNGSHRVIKIRNV